MDCSYRRALSRNLKCNNYCRNGKEKALQFAGEGARLVKKKQKRLQGARKPRKDEEMAWAGTTKKCLGMAKRDKGAVESEWRLEPEGEADVPEIIIVPDAVEGTFVDLDGESRHEHMEAKLPRRGRETLNVSEEIRGPK